MDKKEQSRPVSLRQVQVTDAFWKKEMELVRKGGYPLSVGSPERPASRCGSQASACAILKLQAKLRKRKKEGDAYKEVKWPLIFQPLPEDMDHLEDRFYGCLFQDSDFSKWIEAVGYSLTQHADPELEKNG